jgi:hypothetical protein
MFFFFFNKRTDWVLAAGTIGQSLVDFRHCKEHRNRTTRSIHVPRRHGGGELVLRRSGKERRRGQTREAEIANADLDASMLCLSHEQTLTRKQYDT